MISTRWLTWELIFAGPLVERSRRCDAQGEALGVHWATNGNCSRNAFFNVILPPPMALPPNSA